MIILDGRKMGDKPSLHEELKEKMAFPDYYGGNLDALNDCLGERSERDLIVIRSSGDFLQDNGNYGIKLLQVFVDNGLQVLLD